MRELRRHWNRGSIGVAIVLVALVAGALFTFLFSVLLARLIGASGAGLYFIGLAIVDISVTIARLGLETAVLRFASIAHNRGDRGSLAALYRKSLVLALIMAIAIVPGVWFIVSHLPLGGDRAGDLRAALPLLMLAVPAVSVLGLQAEFFKGIGAPGTGTFVQSVFPPLALIVGGISLWWLTAVTFKSVVITYVAVAFVSAVFALVACNRCLPGIWREPGQFGTRLLLRTSLPLLMVTSMNLVMGWSDILVLGLWSDPKQVGIYGVSRGLAGLTSFVLNAVNSVTAPQFATLHAHGQTADIAKVAQQSAFWMLVVVAPAILVLLSAPELVLQIFGPSFQEGVWALRILCVGQLVNVGTGSVGYLLMMTGHEKLMRNIVIVSAMANLVGNVILIPIYGAIGAAVSTASCVVFMKITCWFMVRKKLKINTLAFLSMRSD
jgi:O-antigen/teichoic acid export membrane protein